VANTKEKKRAGREFEGLPDAPLASDQGVVYTEPLTLRRKILWWCGCAGQNVPPWALVWAGAPTLRPHRIYYPQWVTPGLHFSPNPTLMP
jgi:hypothetical protein